MLSIGGGNLVCLGSPSPLPSRSTWTPGTPANGPGGHPIPSCPLPSHPLLPLKLSSHPLPGYDACSSHSQPDGFPPPPT